MTREQLFIPFDKFANMTWFPALYITLKIQILITKSVPMTFTALTKPNSINLSCVSDKNIFMSSCILLLLFHLSFKSFQSMNLFFFLHCSFFSREKLFLLLFMYGSRLVYNKLYILYNLKIEWKRIHNWCLEAIFMYWMKSILNRKDCGDSNCCARK